MYMALEIERKYLVVSDQYKRMASSCVELSQGYLNRDPERTVRVRIKGEKGYLTVKGKCCVDTRKEFEYEIPYSDALELLALCEKPIIAKTRYFVDFDGFEWEVDEFHGDLAPLVTAEIELPASDMKFPIPDFVGQDVTGDPRYYNSNLLNLA